MKHKLIVGETVNYEDDKFIIISCEWKDGGRYYRLKHVYRDLLICDVSESELLK